jgi:hypothetical protein
MKESATLSESDVDHHVIDITRFYFQQTSGVPTSVGNLNILMQDLRSSWLWRIKSKWIWRRHCPQKRWHPTTTLCSVTSQNTSSWGSYQVAEVKCQWWNCLNIYRSYMLIHLFYYKSLVPYYFGFEVFLFWRSLLVLHQLLVSEKCGNKLNILYLRIILLSLI